MIEMSLQQSEPVALPHRSPGRQVRSVALYSVLTALMICRLMVFVPAALFHCAIRNGRRRRGAGARPWPLPRFWWCSETSASHNVAWVGAA
jgi:hypothetical protein